MNELTHEELTRLLDYDPETGVFRWKVDRRGRGCIKAGDVAGYKGKDGNMISINYKSYSLRRVAWFYIYKNWPVRNLFVKELGWFNDSIKNIGMLPEKPEELTQEYLKECIDYNPGTGSFKWKIGCNGVMYGDVAYYTRKSSLQTKILEKEYAVNRLIWFYMAGEFPDKSDLVLTKNNIMTDLRWNNLAIGSRKDVNQKRKVISSTGFKGVCFDKARKKFKAHIMPCGKNITIGYFPTPEEAHEAYMKAAAEHFGELHNDGYQHAMYEMEYEGVEAMDLTEDVITAAREVDAILDGKIEPVVHHSDDF